MMSGFAQLIQVAMIVTLTGAFSVKDVKKLYQYQKVDGEVYNGEVWDYSVLKSVHRRDTSDITSQKPSNTSLPVQVTNHSYYNSAHYKNGSKFFLDLKDLHLNNDSNVYFHKYLTNSYGRVHSRKLSFKFPFYGHIVNEVKIATGGFLHIGEVLHSFITKTQYVAPLMANFNPKVQVGGRQPGIFLYDDGERFITQWDSVRLDDQRSHGSFIFQVSIFKNGSMVFAYKSVPVSLSSISTANHPVRVGMSDAYIFVQKFGPFTYRRIYRYHTVKLKNELVEEGSAFVLHPIPSCVTAKTCNECLGNSFDGFTCAWCSKLNLCSDTYDWHRQKWFAAGCRTKAFKSLEQCTNQQGQSETLGKRQARPHGVTPGVIAGSIFLVLLIGIIVAISVFYFYAHTHPNTRAGLYIIEHGPRTWFKKKEDTTC